jgi:hypothetical protein
MCQRMSAPRYLLTVALAAVGSLALAWTWTAVMPLAFLDPEYPYWRAKQVLLHRCDLGELVLVGDSRAAADVIPANLPVSTTNLAVGGGTPIEAYAALVRSLRCPVPLRRVVISLDAAHFMRPDLFWERTVRFGFLEPAEVAAVEQVARDLGNTPAFNAHQTDGLPMQLRGALYAMRFPTLYFSSLVKGGVFLRWWRNTTTLQAGIDSRGHYFFGTDAGSSTAAVEAHLPRFQPMPVMDWYFDRMLGSLADRGIPVDFVSMPMNQATWQEVRPAFREAFATYLAFYEARYPGFHVVGPLMPHWPDRFFGDGFSHLNPDGAARFSAMFGQCLAERMAGALCEGSVFLMAATTPSAAAGRTAQHAE